MTEINTFTLGDQVRCSAEFINTSDALIDPATVAFKFKDPSGNVATLVYGTDMELVRDSLGKYHVDVDADEAGTWFYRFESTGSAQSAGEREFVIARSQF